MAEPLAPTRQKASAAPGARSPQTNPAARWDGVERRTGEDRRDRPTRVWDSLLGRRRRLIGRRDGEEQDSYVDRYRRSDVLLVLSIFVLNIFDAAFTLVWLSRGGAEGNPIMDWAIQSGDAVFLFQKCFVAALWLVILLVHKNFRIARIGLWLLLAVYGALGCYHGFLHLFADPI